MLMISVFGIFLMYGAEIRAQSISVDPQLAYTWNRGYPQSCECVETGVTSKDCDIFKCTCGCDLVAGSCDYNCCCDPDCSSDQIDRFRARNVCDNEGFTPDREKFCYSSNELQKVNPRSTVGGKSTSIDALDEMLCVEKINKETKGDFYEDTNIRSASVFGESEGQKDYSYVPEPIHEPLLDAFYDENDTIPAYTNSSAGLVYINSPGFLPLPKSDFSGHCNDNNYAKFRNDMSNQCIRLLGSVASEFMGQCSYGFSSTNTMLTQLLLKTIPSSGVSNSNVVRPTLSSIKTIINGNERDITTLWTDSNCSTGVDAGGSDFDESCIFSDTTSENDIVCRNAIVSIAYTIYHAQDAYSTITNVSVDLVVGDVRFDETGSTDSFVQSFSVKFADTAQQSAVTQANGNQVTRHRSGNPGYLTGSPVLFGSLNSTSRTISPEEYGLAIPSSTLADMSCPDEYSGNLASFGIKFGYDAAVGCVLRLNRSALRNFCCEGAELCDSGYASEYSFSNGVPVFLTPQPGYIGAFGSADPLDASQWFELSQDSAAPLVSNRRWLESSSTCSSMITGIHYKFLVVYTGEKRTPQNKIVAATTEYSTSDIYMRIPYGDEASQQSIAFSTTVSFIYQDSQNLEGYTPPPPPGLVTVPYDVFYPFNIGNSAQKDRNLDWKIVISSISVVMMVFAVYI